jgi:hypothetical protein
MSTMSQLDFDAARRVFGDDLVAPADLAPLLGGAVDAGSGPIPFSSTEAASARENGCVLLYRPARDADGAPITLTSLVERCASAGDPLLRFRAEDPWFAEDEGVARETLEPGWALVHKAPWRETLNQTYARADEALARRAGSVAWRRRRAVEIAFDCLAVAAARRVRLLEAAWDWSSTPSADGGLLNLGGFTDAGIDVLSYSKAVKHGALGVCPTLVRPPAR